MARLKDLLQDPGKYLFEFLQENPHYLQQYPGLNASLTAQTGEYDANGKSCVAWVAVCVGVSHHLWKHRCLHCRREESHSDEIRQRF